jgi:hypothetical protein
MKFNLFLTQYMHFSTNWRSYSRWLAQQCLPGFFYNNFIKYRSPKICFVKLCLLGIRKHLKHFWAKIILK